MSTYENKGYQEPKLGRAVDADKPKPPSKLVRRAKLVWSEFDRNHMANAAVSMLVFFAVSIPVLTIIAGIEAVHWNLSYRTCINPLFHPWLMTVWLEIAVGIFVFFLTLSIDDASKTWDDYYS